MVDPCLACEGFGLNGEISSKGFLRGRLSRWDRGPVPLSLFVEDLGSFLENVLRDGYTDGIGCFLIEVNIHIGH